MPGGSEEYPVNTTTRVVRSAAACGLVAACAAAAPLGAAAHGEIEVADGQYTLVVGFLNEPAFVDQQNGLDLAVMRTAPEGEASPAAGGEMGGDGHEGEPVEGLAGSLQAEVTYGDDTMELELEPAFGEPGHYESVFFPTAEGDYTFRIFGEIEGNPIDEEMTSGPETFSSVESIEPLQFPPVESGSAEDGLALGSVGDVSGGFPGDPSGGVGGMLIGLGGVAALGLALIGARRRLVAAPGAVRA